MNLVDPPDVYGSTVFCEDIRREISGAQSYIGVVTGRIFVQGTFPITLPKFAFAIAIMQSRRIFQPSVGIRIFLPGDGDENASIQAAIGEQEPGASLAAVDAQ